MRISVLLLLGLFVIQSCNMREPKFPIEERVTQELMPLEGSVDPFMIEVKQPFLVLLNSKKEDSIFHFYNLSERKLVNIFGVKGEELKESSTPWKYKIGEFILPILHNVQSGDILISDDIRRVIYRFGINKDGVFNLKERRNYSDSVDNMFPAAFINDTLYALDAEYQAPSLWLMSINKKGPIMVKQYRNPDIFDQYADPDMGRVYANESRIALCYGWKKKIDFLDTNFKLIRSINYKFDDAVDITTENEDDVKATYVYGYFGKRYFYTVFFGKSWKEHRKTFSGTTLEVYDLDGNPVAKYIFDGISPSRFVVDESTFTLYGTIDRYSELKNFLVVYKLKGLS